MTLTVDENDGDFVFEGFEQLCVVENVVFNQFGLREILKHRVHNQPCIVAQMTTGLPHQFDSQTGHGSIGRLLLVATLVASLAKQLAVLLFRHALAALLNNGTHGTPLPEPTERSANEQYGEV
jgi:hypothetical protein